MPSGARFTRSHGGHAALPLNGTDQTGHPGGAGPPDSGVAQPVSGQAGVRAARDRETMQGMTPEVRGFSIPGVHA
jgi:hypothetical protein